MDGVNQVDVTPETVDAEFAALLGQAESDKEEAAFSASGETFDNETGEAVDDTVKQDMAAAVIKGGLVFAIENVTGLKVDDSHYQNVSESLAVVIVKHFDGGLFEFLAEYKEELAAITAVILFVKAVRVAADKKREEAGLAEKQKGGGNAS